MANLQLVCDGTGGLNASFQLQAQDDSGVSHPATGTATIDNYASAFVAQTASGNFFLIQPKIIMTPGQATITVTVTFACSDTSSGAALPSLSVSVNLVAPPPPTPATHLVATSAPVRGVGSNLTDPGSGTISVSLT